MQGLVSIVIEEYHRRGQSPCILIDEYDAPLWVSELAHVKSNLTFINSFFTTLKSNSSLCRFTFVTGVTNVYFSTEILSLISGPDLMNINMQTDSEILVGFSKEEIIHYFSKHVKTMAELKNINMSENDMINEMERIYGGYEFSYDSGYKVYNPASIIKCLSEKKFGNFWAARGHESLCKLIKLPDLSLIFPQDDTIEV